MRNSDSIFYSVAEIEKISNSLSVVDYFHYLEKAGKVEFDRKSGNELYFKTDHNKYAVSQYNYYDFKTDEGGQILKAVMEFEKLEWKHALIFVKNFSQKFMEYGNNAEKKEVDILTGRSISKEIKITDLIRPNNEKLISYFESRGISKQVLVDHTKQIHYEIGNKNYYGIGIENASGGFEIRNSVMKSKAGKNDISELKGDKNEMVVFEGMTDMLSFIKLLKTNNQKNNRTLVTLNSTTNLDKFLDRFINYSGKLFLCLDGDKAGNDATIKIQKSFAAKEIKDIRALYNISETGNNDLNDYLQHKLKIQNKNINLVEQNPVENENSKKQSVNNNREFGETFQPQQKGLNPSGQKLGSENAEIGSEESNRFDLSGGRNSKSIGKTQSENASTNESRENRLGKKLDFISCERTELEKLVEKYKGQKLTN